MAIDKELEAKILRYHHVEKWKVGTISRQLGVHHDVVDRVLSQAGLPKVERSDCPTLTRHSRNQNYGETINLIRNYSPVSA